MVSLKHLSNFWRTLEVSLFNCEINLILSWSANCVVSDTSNQETIFLIADTKRFVLIVTLWTNDYAILLQQLESGFQRTINWNKYQTKVTIQARNQYLNYLIDPIFQGVNRPYH